MATKQPSTIALIVGARSCVVAIQDAVVDLYCLSETKQMIGSAGSTFVLCRLQAERRAINDCATSRTCPLINIPKEAGGG
jgi:hypothetical protein